MDSFEIYSQIMALDDSIKVTYSKDASTASFDFNTKEIKIPTFSFIDEETTHSLVSHEVGHAKYSNYTPDEFNEYNSKFSGLFNVVEDAKIERLLKKEFNGLKNIMKNGYTNLYKNDFFGIENIEEMNLVDRLNIYAKIGYLLDVPFYGEENMFAQRIMNLSSNEDVIKLCEDIYEYLGKQYDALSDVKDSMKKEKGEKSEEKSSGSSSDDKEKEEKQEEETDEEGESQEEKESKEESKKTPKSLEEYLEEQLKDNVSESLYNNIQEAMEELKSREESKRNDILSIKSKDFCHVFNFPEYYDVVKTESFLSSSSTKKSIKMIRNLAKTAETEFKQFKSAEENKQRRIQRVGKLDLKRLSHFKTSENIFIKSRLSNDGTSHGVVIMVDLSNSMFRGGAKSNANHIFMQALIFAQFCYLSGIPFEIVGFGMFAQICDSKEGLKNFPPICILGNSRNFDIEAIFSLSNIKYSCTKNFKLPNSNLFLALGFGNTPMVEGILYSTKVLEKMKNHGIQKTSLFIITDGAYTGHGFTNPEIYAEDTLSTYKTQDVFTEMRRTYVDFDGVSRMNLDNVLYDIDRICPERTKINYTNDWIIEILLYKIKKLYGTYVSYSFISNINLSAKKNNYYINSDLYVLKHYQIFKYEIPEDYTNGLITIDAGDDNPFINQYHVLNVEHFRNQKTSVSDDDFLEKNFEKMNTYKVFVRDFIRKIA